MDLKMGEDLADQVRLYEDVGDLEKLKIKWDEILLFYNEKTHRWSWSCLTWLFNTWLQFQEYSACQEEMHLW